MGTAPGTADERVMRGIVTREHRKALDERREAQMAHSAAVRPAAGAGWSTKGRAPRPAPTVPSEARLRWAQRHPDAAAAERRLRVDRAALLKRWDHKREGTPETHEHHRHRREGALMRLYQTGAIDIEQLNAAVEIAAVAERIGADVAIRTASLETRIDTGGWRAEPMFIEGLSRIRHEVAYGRWRGAVAQLGPVGAVLDMVVGETVGFTVVAKRYGMHNRRAKRLLIEALALWRRELQEACHEIDPATVAAAHAGLG